MANPPPSSQSSPIIIPAVETNTLPQDVLLEILPRLPTKSLIRFRTVHTSWKSLFRNPNFIAPQFRHSNLSPGKVLITTVLPDSEELAAFTLSGGDTLEAVDTSEISKILPTLLLGSCNGVFCVTDRGRNKFLLWNPATTETMVLPPPLIPAAKRFIPNKGIQPLCAAVGFGLDPKGGDLKVVRLMICPEDAHYCTAEVYSLKSRRWKEIHVHLEPTDSDFSFQGNNTYCNGSYHWVSLFDGNMLSFDMTREVFEFSELPIPDFFRWRICKGLSGCLLAITPEDPSMEVRCMVAPNNWKLVKGFKPYVDEFQFLMPVWRDDDEILFLRADEDWGEDCDDPILTGELCFLNITKQEVRKFPNLGKGRVRQLLPYEVSLVSIRNCTGSYDYQA